MVNRIAVVAGSVLIAYTLGLCAIPTDSIGEGSMLGLQPLPTDTVKDTSFHVGDTLWLNKGKGDFCVKPNPSTREDVAYPSAKTSVKIIAGDGFAHGQVTQVFYNPYDLPFNATYVFPLPYNGAVHGMTFTSKLGSFKAIIKEKAEAESLFTAAQKAGQQAALLTQTQRAIFTQKIANILPHDSITVTITFSMALTYDMGTLELAFPTTIGHRYGAPSDPGAATPVYIKPGTRPVNTLDFAILICTPFEISDLKCPNFPTNIASTNVEMLARQSGLLKSGEGIGNGFKAQLVKLSSSDQLPNRDIVVRFKRANSGRDISALSWHDGKKGYFAAQIYPDLADTNNKPQSIDMVFVIDRSGSMAGNPMELSKKIVREMLSRANANDRIYLIAFDNTTQTLFTTPQPANSENIKSANDWVNTLSGGGGTEMLLAVRQALAVPLQPGVKRVMSLITDGGVTFVDSIYAAIKNDRKTIAFAFGVGASPNRDLIDGAASAGNGMGQNIGYNDDIPRVIDNFWTRIRNPQLENVSIDWGSNPPTNLTVETLGSLWLGQPIVVFGQYSVPGNRTITLSGIKGGQKFSESFSVNFVENNELMYSIPQMWARQTIDNLLNVQIAAGNESNKSKILSLSLEYNVWCKYSAFIAIADSSVTDNPAINGKIPLVIPQGTDPALYQYDASVKYSYPIAYPNPSNPGGGPAIDVQSPDLKTPGKQVYCEKFGVLYNSGYVNFRLSGQILSDPTAKVQIFDIRGKLLRTLRITELAASGFKWNLAISNGSSIGQGTYLVILTGSKIRTVLPIFIR